jgi:pimeloyl-ACP methyl ester carboxylesterase
MLKETTFDTGSLLINYAEGPDSGPPLLLLHGLTQRWQEYLQVIPSFIHTHHVFAPDFRGHGKSGHASGSYHGEQYADDVIALMRERVQQPAIVFGHSLGGMVGLYLAAHHPEYVKALVMGDSAIFFRGFGDTVFPSMFSGVERMLKSGMEFEQLRRAIPDLVLHSPRLAGEVPMKLLPGADEAYLTAWARSLSHLDPATLTMSLNGQSAENWRPEEFLRGVRCPMLLIQADPRAGALMSDEDVRRVKEIRPDVQHVKLEGLGHSLHMFQAAPVLRAFTNFLSTLA